MKLPYYFAHRTLLTADSTISHCLLAYSVFFHSFRPQKGVFYSDMVKIASLPGHVGGEKAAGVNCLCITTKHLAIHVRL